jgi:hypothetical protein
MPLIMLPNVINQAITTSVALTRLQSLLLSDDLAAEETLTAAPPGEDAICLAPSDYSWTVCDVFSQPINLHINLPTQARLHEPTCYRTNPRTTARTHAPTHQTNAPLSAIWRCLDAPLPFKCECYLNTRPGRGRRGAESSRDQGACRSVASSPRPFSVVLNFIAPVFSAAHHRQ